MTSNYNHGQLAYKSSEKASEALKRIMEQSNESHRQKTNKELKDVELCIDQTRLEFGEIAIEQKVSTVLAPDGLSHPVTISEDRYRVILFFLAEGVLYLASVALLAGQLITTLDLDQRLIASMIALVFLLMAVVLPLLITVFFKVSPKDAESKEPVEKIFFISLGLGIVAFIAFSMTRATPDIDGFWAFIYTASLPVTELMAAVAASCCSVLRKYFSWSLTLSKKYKKLDSKAGKLRNKLSNLTRNDSDEDLILQTHLDD